MCAAQFSEDNEWYRAKIEKVQGPNVSVFYVDYGNKEVSEVLFVTHSRYILQVP